MIRRGKRSKLKVINPKKRTKASVLDNDELSTTPLSDWLPSALADLLGFDPGPELPGYLAEFSDKEAIAAYLAALIDVSPSDPRIDAFANSLMARITIKSAASSSADHAPAGGNPAQSGGVAAGGEMAASGEMAARTDAAARTDKPQAATTLSLDSKNAASSQYSRKKGSVRGGLELLRQLPAHLRTASGACGCQARVHGLLANCLKCGKIVCEAEGWGPCAHCGEAVGSRGQIKRDSNKVRRRVARAEAERAEALKAAQARTAKLLQQEREYAVRNKIIDDQADYFQTSNVWLSPAERAAVTKRAAAVEDAKIEARDRTKMRTTITFDLAGRRVLVTNPGASARVPAAESEIHDPRALRPVEETAPHGNVELLSYAGTYRNPTLSRPPPMFVAPDYRDKLKAAARDAVAEQQRARRHGVLQHDDYFPIPMVAGNPNLLPPPVEPEEAAKAAAIAAANSPFARTKAEKDRGMALSMHQPWASLLVAGIKRVEGRTWRSDFRGRLWIASTVREPTDEDIAEVEGQYVGSTDIPFPASYPTAALLGCVTVTDVLSHDEYVASASDEVREDNSSPYVFVCANPRLLTVPIAISGDHKIWKLDAHSHAAALANLEDDDGDGGSDD
ncbi:activating signal cointegrator 1 [Thecamonas trahens ATCC 50062]|uniref:Activating signal cointegrator 1 n=1 Tax=Thecamonas trahens ATCC 50062 TaxID=461836 RepID=A0A0L0DP38_THETB|nr:activating signal cointegrator 1 [Thecamonas trahens ATCC 50062]KNC53183.1 activating signal cointegrator 1 [Thecamonas trahens ATCC 50062]|eukprot:XP_013754655.1 activating signal cointegrator 1 [Thecamonas trahens ATCC 50062]